MAGEDFALSRIRGATNAGRAPDQQRDREYQKHLFHDAIPGESGILTRGVKQNPRVRGSLLPRLRFAGSTVARILHAFLQTRPFPPCIVPERAR
jgi:hypothetical protein